MTTHMNLPLPIGTKVRKTSVKPFKSGKKINTIKGYITHSKLNIPCYIFEEDDSYVEVRRCIEVKSSAAFVIEDTFSNANYNPDTIYEICSISEKLDFDILLKVISDIYGKTQKTFFQLNIKNSERTNTFNVNIRYHIIPYLLLSGDYENWEKSSQ